MNHIQEFEMFESFSSTEFARKAKEKIKSLGHSVSREAKQTAKACEVVTKLITGKHPTDDEIELLKDQSVDIVKILAILGLQAVPGSSVALIALEKAVKKYGLTILPK